MNTPEEALRMIEDALEKTLQKKTSVVPDADLIEDKILDSLDGMLFLLELETASNKKFPEKTDLVKQGYYKVPQLVNFLCDAPVTTATHETLHS